MAQTTKDPRRLVFDVLSRVDEGAYADLVLDAALNCAATLDGRDRGLATELVYGVLRHRGRIDFALARCCSKALTTVESRVLNLLRLGAYQMLLLDRVPARAAVHTTVELARSLRLDRATGFINGILRAIDRQRVEIPWPDAQGDTLGHLQHVLSVPPWLGRRWIHEYGIAEALATAEAQLEPAPFTLRINTLRADRESFLRELEQAGHEALACAFAPEGVRLIRRGDGPLPGAEKGWFQVQDEASMLVPRLLAPQAGERILDVCSAPGGKTTQMAALCENRARILATDLHPQRATLVAEGAARLGCEGIEARAWDFTRRPDFLQPESFDRVLLDAPCSGLGVLRRNPETRWRRTEADIRILAALQGNILDHASSLLRKGGVLLYSLCTWTPEETTGVLAGFLAAHPEFIREDLRPLAPVHWAPLFDDEGALRTQPHRHGGMDAFYAVRLRRRD